MADYDAAALFGPSEGAAAAPAAESGFDVAFRDFWDAVKADDPDTARMALKEAVQACYAEEQGGAAPGGDELDALLGGV